MEQNVAGLTVFEQAWAWFEANKKQVSWGAGILVIVGVIVSYYVWSQGEKEISAGEALSDAVAAAVSSGSYAESADAYLKVAAAHPGTSAGARALLAAGGALFTQGKYAEAQAQFQKFSRDYPDSPFRGQAMLGVAAALDAQAKPEEAARAYKELIDRHPGETLVPQAKFALARIYESQNKLGQALGLYEDISRAQSYGSVVNEAGIRAEALRSKLPAQASAPTAAATLPFLSTPPTVKTNKP
ncbi:MAG: tetratricopeptide repeat protein [Verrucomicrobia bacterium]|jgi:TolA-binding protein|nr:tetratricopeptide repeat protein [Verrucomicrobiota bacterium]